MARTALTFDDVVAMCAKFPGTEESTSYGTRAIKVKGKLVIRLKEDGETIVLRTSLVVRDILLHDQPDVFFITDHYRDWPMVLVRLVFVKKRQLTQLIDAAWRENAPPKLISEFDDSTPVPKKRSGGRLRA